MIVRLALGLSLFFASAGGADPFSSAAAWWNAARPWVESDLKGRLAVLYFWSFTCASCRPLIDDIAELEARLGSDLLVLGVHVPRFDGEKDEGAVAAAVARLGIRHAVAQDPKGAVRSAFGVKEWGAVLLHPGTGKIQSRYGPGEGDRLRDDVLRIRSHPGTKLLSAPIPSREPEPARTLRFPGKLAAGTVGGEDVLFIADSGHHRVLGVVGETIRYEMGKKGEPGFRDGSRPESRFRNPQGLLFHDGILYVADAGNHALRAVELATGKVTTLAGTGSRGFTRGPREARADRTALAYPWDLALYPDDRSIALALAGLHQIWIYHRDRKVLDLLAGTGGEGLEDGKPGVLGQPLGLSARGGKLYFVDGATSALRVVADGKVETLVGFGLHAFGLKEGGRTGALLQHPRGLWVGEKEIYVADGLNHALRCFDLGTGKLGPPIRGLSPRLPSAVLRVGEWIYVADTDRHRILMFHPVRNTVRTLFAK